MRHSEIARLRLRNQRLTGPPLTSPAAAVPHLLAVQAQDYPGACWALARRSGAGAAGDIDRALAEGRLVRTHVLRPTWHLVAAEDVRWLLRLTAPRVHAANGTMYRRCELDDPTFRRGRHVIEEALRDGQQLTRSELAVALNAAGIEASGFRLSYLVMHAELEGAIGSGTPRGRQQTYALLDARIPPDLGPANRDESLARLATRFLRGHGPATAHDLAWWSGLTITDARRGIAAAGEALHGIEVEGETFWTHAAGDDDAPAVDHEPVVHLLPNFDEHLIAYRERRPSLDPALFETEPPATAFDGHLVTFDGRLAGGWRREIAPRRLTMTIDLYRTPTTRQTDLLLIEAQRYRRHFGSTTATVEVRTPAGTDTVRLPPAASTMDL